jgi:nucleotide-binding universal stress UspA family protein
MPNVRSPLHVGSIDPGAGHGPVGIVNDMTTPEAEHRIVVAADGSDGSRAALEWACREAALRHMALDLVLVWSTPVAYGPIGMASYGLDPAEFHADAEERLRDLTRTAEELVAGAAEVRPRLREGNAARQVLDAARGADMLVVGSRGWGGFTGLLLGSVSQQCVHHSPCPVVVVPPPDRATADR